jgi:hypothetical protein
MPVEKKVSVKIVMADPHGGVHYIPAKGEQEQVLQHGSTHVLPVGFAAQLVHSRRAVYADPSEDHGTGPLTSEALNADPVPEKAPAPSGRRRS